MSATSFGPSSKITEKMVKEVVSKPENTRKLLKKHGLKPWLDPELARHEEPFVLREVPFRGGRADVIIFGLREDLYVVPVAVEAKSSVNTVRVLTDHIAQIRNTYDRAFTHIYLAYGKIELLKRGETPDDLEFYFKKHFPGLGYGLVTLKDNKKVEILIKASPRKIPKSLSAYYEMASLGTLYMATKEALLKEGYKKLKEGQTSWIGVDSGINFCSYIYGGQAAFGIYALSIARAKELAEFLVDHSELIGVLKEQGYRVYLEAYPAAGGVRGYLRLLDEQPSLELFIKLGVKIKEMKLEKGWGLGLGIYKNLWQVDTTPPSYLTVLKTIQEELKALRSFKQLVLDTISK